jgi:hypothetical protein
MTRHDPHDVIGLWLEEGPVVVPTERRRRMLGEILATPQPRRWTTQLRSALFASPISLGMGAAAAVVLVFAGAVSFHSMQPGLVSPLGSASGPAPYDAVGPTASADRSCEDARAAAPSQSPSTQKKTQDPSPSTRGRSPAAGPLPAGAIDLETLDPSIRVRLGPGWWAGYDYGDDIQAPSGRVAIEHPLEGGGFVRIGFWDTTDLVIIHPISRQGMPPPSDFVRFLLDIESIEGCALSALELGGMTAIHVDFDWTSDLATPFIQPVRGFRAYGFEFDPAERQHWVAALDGQLLINWTVESSSGSASTIPRVRSENSIVRDRLTAERDADRLVEQVLNTLEASVR